MITRFHDVIQECWLFLLNLPDVHFWQIAAILTLFVMLIQLIAIRRREIQLRHARHRNAELERVLFIEQDAHRETQRNLTLRTEGLFRTGQKIKQLRGTTRKKDKEINDLTDELLKLQEWKRTQEREKTERERERQRQEDEREREEAILETIYKYYDNFSRPIFAYIDNDACRGTWHHVQTVAKLAGLAAERIGLSGEFVRAATYFHDLGKAFHPKYFKENWGYNESLGWRQENENYSFYHRGKMILSHLPLGRRLVSRHFTSPPSDLMEMLSAYAGSHEWKEKLFHEAIRRMSSSIEEHQGDTSILGLFHSSIKNGEGTTLEQFRYTTGKKPTTRENGIILLADSCDAAFEGIAIDMQTDIGAIIKSVIFLKISLGLLEKTGLMVDELGGIFEAFTEFFSQKYKIGARIEDKKSDERIFYLESKANPIAESIETLKNINEDHNVRRKVAFYFAHQAENLYKLNQVNNLVDLLLTDLSSLGKDDIYFANIIIALRKYYSLRIHDLLDILREIGVVSVQREKFEQPTLSELMFHPDIRQVLDSDNRCEQVVKRLRQIETVLNEALVNKDILNKTDRYIYDTGFTTYHWLNRQNKVAEPLDPAFVKPAGEVDNGCRLVVEPGTKFVGEIKGKILEIVPRFSFVDCRDGIFTFSVYFKHEDQFLKDMNNFFRTVESGFVACQMLFTSVKSGTDKGLSRIPLNFPLSELHNEGTDDKELSVICQIHDRSNPDVKLLLFHQVETVRLSGPIEDAFEPA